MFKIDKRHFGYRLTFGGYIDAVEMKKWHDESQKELMSQTGDFGVFVDMRTLKPLPQDSQEHMQAGQKLYKQKGMVRSAVILNEPITTMQFKRIAKETGIYNWERYLDASKEKNWEQKGLAWIEKGIDPDK